MNSLNKDVQEYKKQLDKGQIQKAYRGILSFMSDLRADLIKKYPEFSIGAIYPGYMDMTYVAFTPPILKNRGLKIAIVFLHEDGKFEIWLAGSNRTIQAEWIQLLRDKPIGDYRLSKVYPGTDSIVETSLVKEPNFDEIEQLKVEIEEKTIQFMEEIKRLIQ